jgi:hypothetical protein
MTAATSLGTAPRADADGAMAALPATPDQDKRRAALAAQLALRGYELRDTRKGTYIVSRWGLSCPKRCLDRVEDCKRQVGAAQ